MRLVKDKAKQVLLGEVKALFEEHGSITRSDYLKYGSFKRYHIDTYFGSWNNLLMEASIPLNVHYEPTREEVLQKMIELRDKHGKLTAKIQRTESGYSQITIDRLFGSFSNLLQEMEVAQQKTGISYSEEDLLRFIKQAYEQYGYVDAKLLEQTAPVSINTYINRFGTTSEAVRLAGLTYGSIFHQSTSNPARKIIAMMSEILDSKPHIEFAFDWLRSEDEILMPVDAYFEAYNLIVEYHGPHHYEYIPFLHRRKSLKDTQEMDAHKKEQIVSRGYSYIEYSCREPHTFEYVFRKLKEATNFKVVT